jgi:hypothetical protein
MIVDTTASRIGYESPSIQTYDEAYLREQFSEVFNSPIFSDTYNDLAKP